MQEPGFEDAIIYQIDPALFYDSDGDGCGDLAGITERLEYVRDLGADWIWLLPFYPTPYRDGGYDVVDHLGVDPRFGRPEDFDRLLERADELGLRVIIDLVAQHTSIDHRWFQQARSDRDSPYRSYYLWSDDEPQDQLEPVFPGVEDSVWSWDEQAGQYYRHMFYRHEPDLDLAQPAVRDALYRVIDHWLSRGVAGFRIDAVPYMVERARAADPRDDGLWLLDDLRRYVTDRRPGALLLGEVDVPVDEYAGYYGAGDRLSMLLNFWMNNHLFLALTRESGQPIRESLIEIPVPPAPARFANFLRNHDELDLEQLTETERKEVLEAFAPEERMRSYGRGIRRRLAPMLDGDHRRIAMAHALLLSLPGTPVLLYGDEIGMGDDLARSERRAVRIPMQWSGKPNAGFSTAPPDRTIARAVPDGPLGYRRTNVADQRDTDDSLLARVRRLVHARAAHPDLAVSTCEVLEAGPDSVLALRFPESSADLITMINLSPGEVDVTLRIPGLEHYAEIVADRPYPPPAAGLTLGGYGYRWLGRDRGVPYGSSLGTHRP
ncbi:alpha-amylase family protein [Microlunatus parietis]|nr:alpha-amylase family protein [Microlunatus parietis]